MLKKKKFPTNPVKNIIYLLYYQRLLSVIVLLKGKNLLNFYGVLLDIYLNWKEHINYTENKIAKKLGSLAKARPFPDRNVL